MSDNNAPQIKYDVFVSFRGQDIRDGFLSHLIEAFHTKKIKAFVDDKLEKGDEIWSSLVGAIKESSISLIIFSQDYASSHWCLEELVTILECREKYGQIVIPVFYHVEPTNVRHQTGSYKNAFVEHGKKYNLTKMQIWRNTLKNHANLSGIKSSDFRNDAELLKEIINLVLMRLAKPSFNSKGLVGIHKKIADVELLIRKEPKVTRLIGIWGMGGIGKTTIAEEVFNKLQFEYEGGYFLAKEKDQSERHGIISLKEIFFLKLLAEDVNIDTPNVLPNDIERRIGRMRVLIVLDDVNDSDHLEQLLGTLDNFGSGSRIIVTTRDKQVLNANKVDSIYQVGGLSFDEELELFNLNAFNQSELQVKYHELSKRVVNYAKGNPLVLKVLGHLLRGKDKEVWESQLDKLKKLPIKNVYEVMRLSYDDLDHKEQQIFLDLACFFVGLDVKVGYLTSLLKDGESDNSVIVGLERLKDKALITFSEDNFVSMHDIIQEMAWEIVRRESGDPRSHSRLWDPDNIYEVLKNDKGTEAIRSIRMHLSSFRKQKLSRHIFATMSKLQFLYYSREYNQDCFDRHNQDCFYVLTEGLQFLSTELRFLSWYHYPLKSLPENFSAEKLVILDLSHSRMEKLWHGVKNLVNLKEVNLYCSQNLKVLPDFSKATNLEVLNVSRCYRLTSIHPSIFSLGKIEKLDLGRCRTITKLASDTHLCSLTYLNLDMCNNLKEFSLISENMKSLSLEWTSVKTLPSSFGCQSKLESLNLKSTDIERLPPCINNFTQLLYLSVRGCEELQTIPELPPFLETLDAWNCTSLHTLPKLPPSLKILHAERCISLKTVLFPPMVIEQLKENRKQVLFWNCLNLDEHSLVAIELNAQINMMKFANQHLSTRNHDHVENYNDYDHNYYSYQAIFIYPGSCVPGWLVYKTTKDYIIIDLSYAPPSYQLGFIFCFILGELQFLSYGDRFEFNITISDVEGEGKKDSVRMYTHYWPLTIKSEHVCVMYDQNCSSYLNSITKNETRFKIKVTMAVRSIEGRIHTPLQSLLKGFGVSPIRTFAYNKFIQQM